MTYSQDRFRRQIAFKPVGEDGQRMLSDARVAVIGLGALGSTIAERLVRCGVEKEKRIKKQKNITKKNCKK